MLRRLRRRIGGSHRVGVDGGFDGRGVFGHPAMVALRAHDRWPPGAGSRACWGSRRGSPELLPRHQKSAVTIFETACMHISHTHMPFVYSRVTNSRIIQTQRSSDLDESLGDVLDERSEHRPGRWSKEGEVRPLRNERPRRQSGFATPRRSCRNGEDVGPARGKTRWGPGAGAVRDGDRTAGEILVGAGVRQESPGSPGAGE